MPQEERKMEQFAEGESTRDVYKRQTLKLLIHI